MSEVSGDIPTTPLKTLIRNARACEACRASKSRCFFRENQSLCQRCEQGGHPCVVRTKARPMRARAARPTQIITKNISPRPDGSEFSLELPSCSAPDGIKDVRDLHDHHKHVFGDDESEIRDATSEEGPRIIEHRKLGLRDAENLLSRYRRMQSFFPFVVVSSETTIPYLSRTSPFLLLAILTVASSMDPQLRYQIDQEFRRILSAKVIVDGQKSLDYLQGLLLYIAWYPLHSRPKNNQAFMYINVAISLAVDLGLHNENPSTDGFTATRQEGLVANGCFTQEARRAYLGAYYVSSALSMGFQKPNHLQYRNLMDVQGEFLLQNEHQTDVIALITIQRLIEKISIYHRDKEIDPNDVNRLVNAEISVQIFHNELEQWRLSTPDETKNIPMVGLAERFAGITIYSHQIGFLKQPYRDHIDNISKAALQSPSHLTACLDACKRFFEYLLALPESLYPSFGTTQWAMVVQSTLVLSRLAFLLASTMGWDADTTRANVPMVMYLDALCYRFQALSGTSPRDGTPRNPDPLYVFKMVLGSVKRSYEKRVANIIPKAISVEKGNVREMARGHCPVLDPTLKPYFTDFQVESENGGWGGDMTAMGSMPLNGADWSGTVGTPESLGSYESMGSYGSLGSIPAVGGTPLLYHDLWATMTCSWAAEEPSFSGAL